MSEVTDRQPTQADIEALYPRLVRRLLLIVRDPEEARDLAQSTFLRAHAARSTIEADRLAGWLMTVGTRLAINEARRRRRWGWLQIRETDRIGEIVADPDLWQALGELDRRQRAALVMNVVDGYTHEEIASELGVAIGTVSSWISRSKQRMRTKLESRS